MASTLQAAIQESAYDSARIIDMNNYGFYVDANEDGGFDIKEGVEGMPVTWQGHYATIEQIMAALPEHIAQSDEWEAVGEAES